MVLRSLPFVLACTLLAGAPQEDSPKWTREFVEGLSSVDPAVREATVQNLKKLGEVARPILIAAAKETDPEVTSRAKFLLRRIDAAAKIPQGASRISPALLDRIAESGSGGWGEVFIHLAGQSDIPRRDLERVVPLAFEAPTAEQYGPICDAVSKRECRAAIPY